MFGDAKGCKEWRLSPPRGLAVKNIWQQNTGVMVLAAYGNRTLSLHSDALFMKRAVVCAALKTVGFLQKKYSVSVKHGNEKAECVCVLTDGVR